MTVNVAQLVTSNLFRIELATAEKRIAMTFVVAD